MEGCPCFRKGVLMRGLSRNKQVLYYSLHGEREPIYAKDEEGNIIYDTLPNGRTVPRETGEETNGYAEPVKFMGNIARGAGIADTMPYGIDLSGYDAVLYVPKDLLPLTEMSLIWYQNEPVVKDGKVDETSADYRVKRVPPSLDEMVYLLEGVV